MRKSSRNEDARYLRDLNDISHGLRYNKSKMRSMYLFC